jgi:hypothetical protein
MSIFGVWSGGGDAVATARTKAEADPCGMTSKRTSNGKNRAKTDPYGMTAKEQATAQAKEQATAKQGGEWTRCC